MQLKTELVNRIVWYDGTNQVHPSMVPELFLYGVRPDKIVVTEMNADIRQFNQLSDVTIASEKTENNPLNFEWDVPEKYLDIQLPHYVEGKLEIYLSEKFKLKNWSEQDQATRNLVESYCSRLADELAQIEERNMTELFCSLIYVLTTLKESNTIWGVGRGSSCASLVLFLIGIHKVDPVKFDIPLSEFFHD